MRSAISDARAWLVWRSGDGIVGFVFEALRSLDSESEPAWVELSPHPPAAQRTVPLRLVVAVVATLPAAVFLACSVLQYGVGIPNAVSWMDPAFDTAGVRVLTIGVVLLGPTVAAVLALTWLLPVRWRPDGDSWELRIRVRLHPIAISILGISLLCGAVLYGHIAAENAACAIGLTARC
jgi:hypothetical protein